MNYLIIGLGSVGTVLANSLILEKDDKIYALRSKKSLEKEIKLEVDVIEHLKDQIKISKNNILQYENESIDVAFVTTKSNYLIQMNEILENLKGKNIKVISLMNGMGWEDYFEGFNTYYGIIMYNAFRKEEKVILGSKGGLILDKNLEYILKNKFRTIPVSFVDNIEEYRYRKLWLNTINGFLSLFGCSLYQFFEESKRLEFKPLKVFYNYLNETKELYEKLNIKPVILPSLDPQILLNLMEKLIKKGKLNEKEEKLFNNLPKGKNSTLQSIENREDTEYRFLGGYLVNLANKFNLSYKLNRFINDRIEKYHLSGEFEFMKIEELLKL